MWNSLEAVVFCDYVFYHNGKEMFARHPHPPPPLASPKLEIKPESYRYEWSIYWRK